MSRAAGTLKPVACWALPNYAALALLAILCLLAASSIPLRVQHRLEGFWMLFALLLPISTIMAAVKAIQLSFRADEHLEIHVWQSVVAWGLVALALAFNVFSYVVILRTLR